jgi:2-polyprenyl-6-methoxyphenol hydroxylase-like FAD-dependent oxidoreductase
VLRFVLRTRDFLGRGQPIEFLDTHDKQGRLIHSQPVRPEGLGIPAPAMMFLRTELFRLLAAGLGERDIRYGMGCERLEDLGDQVRITFGNGQVSDFDLVIGADGVSSTVRGFVDPGMVPYDTGLVASRGVVAFRSPLLHSDRCQIFAGRHLSAQRGHLAALLVRRLPASQSAAARPRRPAGAVRRPAGGTAADDRGDRGEGDPHPQAQGPDG